MSPLFLLCIFFLSCPVALRGDDFALCKPLTCKLLFVTSTYPQQMRIHHSLSFLHGLPCLNLCFNRKFLPIPFSRPTLKLTIVHLLAGDVTINCGPAINHNTRFATTNVPSVRGKTATVSDLLFFLKIDILANTETWLRPRDTAACIADISPSGHTFHGRPRSVGRGDGVGFLLSDHFKVNSQLIPDYF